MMDIVFLLDALNSHVMSGFSSLLAFINDVIDRFPSIGRQSTRVALVSYAEHPRVEIFLDDFDNKDDLQVTLQLVHMCHHIRHHHNLCNVRLLS